MLKEYKIIKIEITWQVNVILKLIFSTFFKFHINISNTFFN